MRGTRGITLITLIVTIILLLILVGITISSLTGKNGLLTKTKNAKEQIENSEIKENIILGNYENEIGKYVNGTREAVTIDEYNKMKNEYDTFKKNIIQALNSKNCNLNQNESNDEIVKSINELLVGNVQKIAEDLSGKASQSISISNIEGYEYLTEDNFILVLKGLGSVGPKDGESVMEISKTYDSTSGQLTISRCKNYYTATNVTVWAIYDVYLIL